MLTVMCPRTHHRYAALPLLGSLVDAFAVWLSQCDYRPETIRVMLGPLDQVDQWLQRHDIQDITDLDAPMLEACWRHLSRRSTVLGGLIRALARYMEADRALTAYRHHRPPTPSQRLLGDRTPSICVHVRGLTPSTIAEHTRQSLAAFLGHLDYDGPPTGLEESAARVGSSPSSACVLRRLGRGSQQHLVAHLRSFLRFLAATWPVPLWPRCHHRHTTAVPSRAAPTRAALGDRPGAAGVD